MTPARIPRVAITGLGVVSPFGCDLESLVDGIASGRAAVREMEPTGRPGRTVPVIPCDGFDATKFLPPMKVRRWDACSRFAAVSALLALRDAGLESREAERVGILAGTFSSGATPLVDFLAAIFRESPEAAPPMLFPFTVANAAASQAAIELSLKGPIATLSHRAVVFADCLLYASILLEDGRADAIVVVGTDEVNPTYLRAWDDLGLVAAPGRPGFVLGEGGYALVLERPADAAKRRAKIRSVVSGIGFAQELVGPHVYPHDPATWTAVFGDALARAGRRPVDVDFVSLADNGHPGPAAAERTAVDTLFGAGPHRPYLARWKGALGEGAGPSAAAALLASAAVSGTPLPPDRGGAMPGDGTPAPADCRFGLVNFAGAGGAAFTVAVERPGDGMDTQVLRRPA